MGLWDKVFWPKKTQVTQPVGKPFATFTESVPVSVSYTGEVYEQELTRACIDRFATTCSKLQPSYEGVPNRVVERIVKTAPNEFQTWPQFLYRTATVLEIENTCAIVPVFAPDAETITGFYPLVYEAAEVVDYHGTPWVKFYTIGHDGAMEPTHAIELRYVCFLTRFQYRSDLFGSPNGPTSTLDLMHAQEEAQKAAIQNGARVRWIGAVSSRMDEKELEKKRKRFVETNLTPDNEGGILVYDQTFTNVEQVKDQSYVIDPVEMERIEQDVLTYYGTSKAILQNDYQPNQWAAYYEGKIEPFALQLGEGITKMLFTQRQRLHNKFMFSSQRLQYAAMAEKRNMIRDMVDRGLMSLNEGRDILQMPHVPLGDMFVIRGEYLELSQVDMTERQHDSDKEHQLLEKPLYEDMSNDAEDDENAEA